MVLTRLILAFLTGGRYPSHVIARSRHPSLSSHELSLLKSKQCIHTMSSNNEPDDGVQRPLLADTGEPEYGTADGAATASSEQLERGTFTRNLGAIDAFAIIISIVIGSGVFTSPGSIDSNVPSPGVALVIWLVGGVLAWTGASTLAELGTAIPGEGLSH